MSNEHFGIFKQRLDQDSAEPIVTWPERTGNPPLTTIDLQPRPTPDGRWILFALCSRAGLQPPSQIMRVPIGGGSPEFVLTATISEPPRCARLPGTPCMIAEWTSDRKELIFTALDPIKGRGPELARLNADANRCGYTSDISPDGSRIAVGSMPDGQFYILSSKGKVLQQFKVENWRGFLDWTADGQGLFVSSMGLHGAALLHVDLRGKARVMWEPPGNFGISAISSPDGRKLAISAWGANSNLWMLENF